MKTRLRIFMLASILPLLSVRSILACTIAVISGSVTSDGRPLLWENRDISRQNQEVRYFDDGSQGAYLALVTTGNNELTTSYIGVNEAGLAIMNSVAPDLSSGSPSSHGIFMKRALRECGTVADFEALLTTTSGDRGHIWTNFGVIDAAGEAAIFETTDSDFRRYDADDAGGYVVRANNSIWGGGDMGGRFANASQLIEDAVAADQLDHRFIIRTVARDLGDTPSMPCGEWPAVEPALNRHQTRSSGVVHGVLPGEDPRLSTFWCTLGEPSCGVSIPLWAFAGATPNEISDPGERSAMCRVIQEKELHCYGDLVNDSTIDTNSLVGDDGAGGVHRYSLPIEDELLDLSASRLHGWRQVFPSSQEIAQFQSRQVERSLFHLDLEKAPGEVTLPPATELAAMPGHREINISWTDPAGDPVEVEIWRALWHDGYGNSAYPLYQQNPNAVLPLRPTDRSAALASGEWFLLDVIEPGIEHYADPVTERGVYCYEIYARDGGYNYCLPAESGCSATNYWLGDVSDGDYGQGDGFVNTADITALATSYGLTSAHESFLPGCDTGPTDDFSASGIPLPDDGVDFEDLMIFSLNYGLVEPLPIHQGGAVADARIGWEPRGDGLWALVLEQPCLNLKGLRLRADLPAASVHDLRPGALCGEQVGFVFLDNIDANGLDVGLTLMGNGLVFIGAGDLLLVAFVAGPDPESITVTARGADNEAIVADMIMTPSSDVPPLAERLLGNFPNPFNPQTEISFVLSAATHVSLDIHDVNGRRLRQLIKDETMPAGVGSRIWRGRDDRGRSVGSGIYVYRLRAGSFSASGKMLLLE